MYQPTTACHHPHFFCSPFSVTSSIPPYASDSSTGNVGAGEEERDLCRKLGKLTEFRNLSFQPWFAVDDAKTCCGTCNPALAFPLLAGSAMTCKVVSGLRLLCMRLLGDRRTGNGEMGGRGNIMFPYLGFKVSSVGLLHEIPDSLCSCLFAASGFSSRPENMSWRCRISTCQLPRCQSGISCSSDSPLNLRRIIGRRNLVHQVS